jgi:hypothetical protein
MWGLSIVLVIIGVVMSVIALPVKTVAVTYAKTEAQNATMRVALPSGMKAFPAELVPLP